MLRALIGLTVIIVPAALVGCDGGQAAAAPRTIEFVVEGMHCDGCAEAISHGVGDVTGVLACRVDHVNGTATIEVASADPQIEAVLAEAIAKLGFVVRYSDAERASPGS